MTCFATCECQGITIPREVIKQIDSECRIPRVVLIHVRSIQVHCVDNSNTVNSFAIHGIIVLNSEQLWLKFLTKVFPQFPWWIYLGHFSLYIKHAKNCLCKNSKFRLSYKWITTHMNVQWDIWKARGIQDGILLTWMSQVLQSVHTHLLISVVAKNV